MTRHLAKENIQMANTHTKMFNIISHLGNGNQNHNEIPSHTSQDGYFQNKQTNKQKVKQILTSVEEDVEKLEPGATLVEMQNCVAMLENS